MHAYQIQEGKKVSLIDFDPNDTKLWKLDKKDAKKTIKDLRKELINLQRLLYAEQKHKVLIVLQAMDGGGKDGTIRSIFKGVNPQGVRVANFKVLTPEEIGHDYLWRIHKQTPKSGEIVIFNRSHYEDVLVVRVHQLVSEKVWRKRYDHILNFEKTLTDEGTTILKFFLHISKEEQKERFIERIEDSEKQWKFNPKDIDERKLWNDYMHAYEDALIKTSTVHAPWYVIPANRNWYRDYVIIKIITEALKKLNMTYPKPVENIKQYKSMLK
jgi:PPK2 family polyphosphate:nucleotide phosphotransferase